MTTDVVSFLKELCEQTRKRFPLSEDCVLAKLSLLVPSSIEKPSIVSLALHFPNLAKEEDLDQLEEQWRSLCMPATQSATYMAWSRQHFGVD